MWPLDADGELGRFRANPDYVPSDPNSSAGPLDALFRFLMANQVDPDQLQLLLRDTEFEVALGAKQGPLIVQSPDDVSCVLVVTSQHYRLSSPKIGAWWRVGIKEFTDLLPDGIDVLFNPGSPGSVRLAGDFVRSACELSAEQLSAVRESLPVTAGEDLQIFGWRIQPAVSGE